MSVYYIMKENNLIYLIILLHFIESSY